MLALRRTKRASQTSREPIQDYKGSIIIFQLTLANPTNTLRTAIIKAYETATCKTEVQSQTEQAPRVRQIRIDKANKKISAIRTHITPNKINVSAHFAL